MCGREVPIITWKNKEAFATQEHRDVSPRRMLRYGDFCRVSPPNAEVLIEGLNSDGGEDGLDD